MSQELYEFCENRYVRSKADLATTLLERWIDGTIYGGNIDMVMPQNWLFLKSYRKFRESILRKYSLSYVVLLGAGAFETISGEVVKVALLGFKITKSDIKTTPFGLDVSLSNSPIKKAINIITDNILNSLQSQILKNPDSRIAIGKKLNSPLLEPYAISKRGIVNGDNERWLLRSWEIPKKLYLKKWVFIQSAVNNPVHFGGREFIIDWSKNGSGMLRPGLNNPTYGQCGVSLSRMGYLPVTIYTGELYDQNVAVIVPNEISNLPATLCYAEDSLFNSEVRWIDKKVGVTPATFLKVPFDLNHWTKVAQEKYPHGLPKPYTDDPTQWIFHGHPCGSVIWDEEKKWTAHGSLRVEANVLHVAVARLLGYQWPAELDDNMELAEEQRWWVEKSKEFAPLADEDGIVCIPPVRGESAAVDPLFAILVRSYGSGWSNNVLDQLLAEAGHSGKTLETWLRDKFFAQHCRLFHHRPFIWQIWDGLRDGFSALVNYHMLDFKNLETLTYTYLGDWIARQKQAITDGVDGAEEKLAAARNLKKKLELILEGEKPYDIFVRWKPLEKQPIGWNPDINDGVRLNIRPFMSVGDVGRKGAGILRDKPNIHWNKDRGKDVKSAPWFHLFKGERINDHHLSLDEKFLARKQADIVA